MPPRIESLLSARLQLSPQIVGERIYFISSLSGRLSLYAMHYGGSIPEPLLPGRISMQNPILLGGLSYFVFPLLDRILVMLDRDGDENYQPVLVPIEGGFPEAAFDNFFQGQRLHLAQCDAERNIAYFQAEACDQAVHSAYRVDLRTNKIDKLDESEWELSPCAHSADHARVLLIHTHPLGDNVLYLLDGGRKAVLFGTPDHQRSNGQADHRNGLEAAAFTPSETGALVLSAVFDDRFSLGVIDFASPDDLQPVRLEGLAHTGQGELAGFRHLKGTHYALLFNIDGCSWLYEGIYNEDKCSMLLRHVIAGDGDLAGGVLQHYHYDRSSDRFGLSFSTATSPTQLYTVEGKDRMTVVMHTEERLLGLAESALSQGEEASFVSFDGTRISARLYLPAESHGLPGPRPLVYYIHGGPQGQERPDFAWFSMPLIQFLTLGGFAVFVPNVRGSTGYGLKFTSQVDNDWGGQDRLDHVHAMTKVLPKDPRLDLKRAGVVGRSYGGYMTLTLAGRHPQLWQAACDMFGPYDLLTFSERIPETWKPHYRQALADPATDAGRQFLQERSPKTYLEALACPLLVIQGRNDPRVVAQESQDLAADLQKKGKQIELLVFEDEGHDVLKHANRVTCYNAIADFFTRNLMKS